jgi:hypothetical protein
MKTAILNELEALMESGIISQFQHIVIGLQILAGVWDSDIAQYEHSPITVGEATDLIVTISEVK